jgi:tRNA 5-methylaminomethyl-2-thiouridine biosynthesis bifunctional protein
MPQALVPARLDFREEVPFSQGFDDVYHSAHGGPAGGLRQARHVFLDGNGLPARWAGRERFVVFETGFGLGLNFLATWRAWREDPSRCGRLHYVAVEKHPFSLQDLRTLHQRYPDLREEAAQLHSAWPLLVPGGHRAQLDGGRVVLTVFFADISVTRDLRLSADAFYLDGFAPAKNPEMWSPQLFRALSRLAAPGATAATWSVAAPVREALELVGFRTQKRPGYGAKREMLCASYRKEASDGTPRERKATVIGAGLAGAAMCERLCARGWDVTLFERHAAPAQEGSGNHAGAFHPIVTPDDSVFARLTRAGFLASLNTFARLSGVRWDPCGALQLARNDKEAASQEVAMAALALPPEYARVVTRDEAAQHAGVAVAAGGLWFANAGWVQPRSLVDALLEACGSRLQRRFSQPFSLEAEMRENSVTILATANDAVHPIPHARLRKVRGQLTYFPADRLGPPHVVVLRGGMVLPPVDGVCVAGASFDIDDDDPAPRASSDEGNLERLGRILPEFNRGDGKIELKSRVAFRAVARDRLPLAGRVRDDLWCTLALGSRGLIWAPLAAELVASRLEGEPLPLEGKLVDALDPLRFERRAAARKEGASGSSGHSCRL